jgi:UDP-N-acetylmuramate dehydrogenase
MEIPAQTPDFSLKTYNTFGIDASCHSFCQIDSAQNLQNFLQEHPTLQPSDFFVLGGGSNLLLVNDLKKIVLYNQIKGIQLQAAQGNKTIIQVGGGVAWNDLVEWSLMQGLGGIENLSLIPGSVGAAPIQNIGAYGVELKDVFHKLEAISLEDGSIRMFTKDECDFGYRNSVFKKELKALYFISAVYLELTNADHTIHADYGAIQTEMARRSISTPRPADISEIVVAIRKSKLPDPDEIGNSGSFFKNPVVDQQTIMRLNKSFPDLRYYELGNKEFKLAAGWLIEKAGWKGKTIGNVACFKNQALVIVNLGNATGKEIWNHALRVIESVDQMFQVRLEPEVNILGL